jgi:hypothetical protein
VTPNDRFVLLTDLLEGGARSQADQLQERMPKELDASNAMELAEYEASLVMHHVRVAEWNALPAEGRGPAPVAPAEEAPVAKTLYRDPLGQFWALFGRLYPKRSSNRIEKYRDFKPLPGESTFNLVNRLDLLHMQIRGPELQAVNKLLDALRKDMRTEVQQKCQLALHIKRIGLSVVLVRLRKRLSGMLQSCLCTLGRPRDLGG